MFSLGKYDGSREGSNKELPNFQGLVGMSYLRNLFINTIEYTRPLQLCASRLAQQLFLSFRGAYSNQAAFSLHICIGGKSTPRFYARKLSGSLLFIDLTFVVNICNKSRSCHHKQRNDSIYVSHIKGKH